MKIDIKKNSKIFLRFGPMQIGNVIKILAGTDDFDITDLDFEEEELYNLLISQEENRQNKESERMKKAWETRRTKAESQKREFEELKKQIAEQSNKNQKEDLPKRDLNEYKKAFKSNNNQNADYSTFYFSKVKQDFTP